MQTFSLIVILAAVIFGLSWMFFGRPRTKTEAVRVTDKLFLVLRKHNLTKWILWVVVALVVLSFLLPGFASP